MARLLAARMVRNRALWRLLQQHGRLLAAVVLAAAATAVTTTLPAMAVPLLSSEFQLSQRQAHWTHTAALLAMAGTMLATPWLVQRLGLVPVFKAAIAVLLFGAVGCSLASSFNALLVFRVVQGLAAAVLQPMPALVVMAVCPPRLYGRVTSLLGMLPTLAVALAPGLAGALMHNFGWRAVFWLSWPLCAAAWWLARLSTRCASGQAPLAPPEAVQSRLDLPSLVLVNLGLTALLIGVVQWRAQHTGVAAALLCCALVAVGALGLWIRRLQRKPAKMGRPPLLDPVLLRHDHFGQGCIVFFLYGLLLYGTTYLLPILMQGCLDMNITTVGTVLLVAGLAMTSGMAKAGSLIDRRPRLPLISLGLALLAGSLVLLPWLSVDGWVMLSAGAALGRLGMGLALAALLVTTLRSLPTGWSAQGTIVAAFMQTVGGALGAGLSGVFLDWRLSLRPILPCMTGLVPPTCPAADDTLLALALLALLASVLAWPLRGPAALG